MKNNNDEEFQFLKIKQDTSNSQINKNQNEEISNTKEEEKKIRNSSFEILRIILMNFIILSHILFHTETLPKLDEKNFTKIINGRYIFLRILSNYGKFGDITFMMISGYFSIKRLKFHYIKFILIATETYVYHYLLLFLSFKLKDIYKDIELLRQKNGSIYFPLTSKLGHWFTQHYLILLIFLPYINKGLLSLSHKEYQTLIYLILIFFCILRSLTVVYKIENNIFLANQIIKLLLPYIIGGYISIYDLKFKKFWKIFGIVCFILTIIFEYIFENLAKYYKNYIFILWQNELSLNINSLLLYLSSIGIICLLKDIKIYSKIINFISASVLGIYLIHANKNISPFIYNAWFKTNDYNQENFFIRYVTKSYLIFGICLIIDIIRRYTIGIIIEIILNYIIGLFKNI